VVPEHLDRPAEMVFTQLNTKTVGAPESATGLTGDQAPDTIMAVADFDRVRNQINIQKRNKQALEVLNEIGRITGMQSQSGPIPNTQFCTSVTDATGSGNVTGDVYVPEPGTVWQLSAAEWLTKNGSNARLRIYDTSNDVVIQISLISAAGIFELNEPIYIGYPCKLVYQVISSSGSNIIGASLVRVR
jgi:hypothetical protein